MSNTSFIREALFEHRFWLQILGDHGRFIHDALAPDEKEKIKTADYFIRAFDELLDHSRMQLNEDQLLALTKQALTLAEELRCFKLELLREHLVGRIKISLPPTFINHMVNELEEYLRILQCLLEMKIPAAHPLHYHKLWLLDAVGHAEAIKCRLDGLEKELRIKSKEFKKEFSILHTRAEEFSGYTRTCLLEFPALKRLNDMAENNMVIFMCFLKELEELIVTKGALGILDPLTPDHMYREECYYLISLSRVSEVREPDCNPTMRRISD